MWSQRQGVNRFGLSAAANGQIRMAHERRARLPAGAAKGDVVDGHRRVELSEQSEQLMARIVPIVRYVRQRLAF